MSVYTKSDAHQASSFKAISGPTSIYVQFETRVSQCPSEKLQVQVDQRIFGNGRKTRALKGTLHTSNYVVYPPSSAPVKFHPIIPIVMGNKRMTRSSRDRLHTPRQVYRSRKLYSNAIVLPETCLRKSALSRAGSRNSSRSTQNLLSAQEMLSLYCNRRRSLRRQWRDCATLRSHRPAAQSAYSSTLSSTTIARSYYTLEPLKSPLYVCFVNLFASMTGQGTPQHDLSLRISFCLARIQQFPACCLPGSECLAAYPY